MPLGHYNSTLIHFDLPEIVSVGQLFAFHFTPTPPFTATGGWQIYNPKAEFKRMGLEVTNHQWRFSEINKSFSVSSMMDTVITKVSYPMLGTKS